MNLTIFEKIKILIIEDDLTSRVLLKSMFENKQLYEITEAIDGEDAISKLLISEYDLILLDIHMPKKDGIYVLKTIRRSKKFLLTPVIVLTVDAYEKITALRLGANDYLTKPYDKTELRLRIQNQIKIKLYSKEIQNQIIYEKLKNFNDKICKVEETQRKFLLKIAMQSERQMFFADTLKAEKIASYAKELTRLCCNLPKETLKNVYYSAAFHNIGFISLPNEIKNKQGQFTKEDRKIMQKHISYGAKFLSGLENTGLISIAKPIIEEYCERWDGKGYPKGLSGDDISFYARVVAIVVFFNALTSPRGYRKNSTFSNKEVCYIIKKQSNRMFDPILVDVFLENFNRFLRIKDFINKKRLSVG